MHLPQLSSFCKILELLLSPLRRIYGPTTPDADDADGIMITTTLSLFSFSFFFAYLYCSLSLSLKRGWYNSKSTMLIPGQHLNPHSTYFVQVACSILYRYSEQTRGNQIKSFRAPLSINHPPLVGRPASNLSSRSKY